MLRPRWTAQIPARNLIEIAGRKRRALTSATEREAVETAEHWSEAIVRMAQHYRGGLLMLEDIPSKDRSDVCAWLVSHPRFQTRKARS